MISVNTAFRTRDLEDSPIRFAAVGAGYMDRGLALQIETAIQGIRVGAHYGRAPSVAERAFKAHINRA